MDIESIRSKILQGVDTDLDRLIFQANFSRFITKDEDEVKSYLNKFPMNPIKYKQIGEEEIGLAYYYVSGIYPIRDNILEIPISKDIAEITQSGELVVYKEKELYSCLGFKNMD